ncbi:MAG: hypothetical protein K2J82_10790 [Muribaculaceae bacterium]|nr:hypothetical protein [Muribaculaceae bacterium]
MTDFIKNFRAIHHFVKGILSNGRNEYTLSFVQDPDGRWYIDMPWDGNRANLEMVAGSDDLLSFLDTEGQHRVTLHVIPSENRKNVEGHTELRQLDKSLTGGSHYDATDIEGFRMRRIWVCPVTLCVLGRYPKYLYIKKVEN